MPTSETVEEAGRLGDLVNGHPEHVAEVVPRLAAIVAATKDPAVIAAAIESLGCAWHPAAATVLLEQVPLNHPDAAVRLELARALPAGVDSGDDVCDRVIVALTALTRDTESAVRDWAAFGLGQVEAETPSALDALAALLHDDDNDARCEAIFALARAGDDRASTALIARLNADGEDTVWKLELEAAAALADPNLHLPLQRLKAEWNEDEDDFIDSLHVALARTHPDAAGLARQAERNVVEEVRHAYPGATSIELQRAYPRTVLVLTVPHAPDFEMELWARQEDPAHYPTSIVVNAVLGSLPPAND